MFFNLTFFPQQLQKVLKCFIILKIVYYCFNDFKSSNIKELMVISWY